MLALYKGNYSEVNEKITPHIVICGNNFGKAEASRNIMSSF